MIQTLNSLNLSFLWFPRNWGIYTFLVFFRKQQGVIFTALFGLSGKINQCWSDGNNKATPRNNGGDQNLVAVRTLSSFYEFFTKQHGDFIRSSKCKNSSNTKVFYSSFPHQQSEENVKPVQTLKFSIVVLHDHTEMVSPDQNVIAVQALKSCIEL